jgi:hypothetical protein
MAEYISKAFTGFKPIWGGIMGIIYYIFFPDRAYFLALMAVVAAASLDIVTKMYAVCKANGGYREATKTGKYFSKTLWKGTEIKIISYLVVTLLTGLSYRVIYLKEAGILIASFVYSVMFMREFQSNIENLCEAGADLQWLLIFARKKNKDLTKDMEETEKPKEGGYDGRV